MKFGFVTNIPNPYNESLFAELRKLGHGVTVLYARQPSAEGREWRVADHGSEHVASSLRRGHAHLLDLFRSVDTVIVSGSYVDPMAIEALVWGPRYDHPILFWGEPLRRGGLRQLVRRGLFYRLDGVLAVGRRAEWGYRKVVRRGCPVWNFPYVAAPSGHQQPRTIDEQVVGFAGSVNARKGVDLIIDAMVAMKATSRPALEIAGSGTDLRRLSERAQAQHLNVRWLGFIQPSELRERQSSWTVQVVPSRYDGWGVVVNEALGAGRPVLVSAQTGAGVDLVRSGFNGEVIYADSAWASAIAGTLAKGSAQIESDNARMVGEAVASDRAAAWLVETLNEYPRSADFVSDAFARQGLSFEWNRLVARPDRGPGLADDGWRVAYMGPSGSSPPRDLISACLAGIGTASMQDGHGGSDCWAMSRQAYETLPPAIQACLAPGCEVPTALTPILRLRNRSRLPPEEW